MIERVNTEIIRSIALMLWLVNAFFKLNSENVAVFFQINGQVKPWMVVLWFLILVEIMLNENVACVNLEIQCKLQPFAAFTLQYFKRKSAVSLCFAIIR